MYSRYREYADSEGLTDFAVSKLTGVSRRCISDWKNGKHQPSLRNRHKIAMYFGLNNDFTPKTDKKIS